MLNVCLTGGVVTGANPGWLGSATADLPFAALVLVRAGCAVYWAKAEVARDNCLPITLYLHPLDYERSRVQFLFSIGSGIVHDVCAQPEDITFGRLL